MCCWIGIMESTNRDRPRVPGERALRITWLQSEVGEQGCLGNGSPASPHACVDTSASRMTKTRIDNGMKREKFLKVKKPLKVAGSISSPNPSHTPSQTPSQMTPQCCPRKGDEAPERTMLHQKGRRQGPSFFTGF